MNEPRERAPLRLGEFRGWRYGPIEPELLARIGRWAESGTVEGGTELKGRSVARFEGWVVKFGERQTKLVDRLRPARALRGAELHFRLRPLRTPRPLVALERRTPSRGIAADLLVCEFVAGGHLHEIWESDPAAVQAFPDFMAALHAHGVFHGDFQVLNSVWSGADWVLLDLEDVRHSLHALRRSRLVLDQWGLLCFSLEFHAGCGEQELRGLFERYWRAVGRPGGGDARWDAVRRRVERHREQYRRAGILGAGAYPRGPGAARAPAEETPREART